jgi:hypothetical protein
LEKEATITSYNSLIDWDKYIGINNNYLFASNKIERKRKKEKKKLSGMKYPYSTRIINPN